MRQHAAQRTPRDRGVAAVEFALLLPMLLLLILGIIDFGRALNAQITLTQAARTGARVAAVDNSSGVPNSSATVTSAAKTAATGLSGVTVTVTTCAANAGPAANATVKVSYTYNFITPVSSVARLFGSSFGSSIALSATGVMPCET